MPVQKAKNFWPTIKRLFGYMSKRSIAIIAVFVLAITATVFQIRTPKILGEATTLIFEGVQKGFIQRQAGIEVDKLPIDYDKIASILLVVGLMYVASALFSFLQQFIMTRVSQRTVYELRRDLKGKMNTVPMEYFDTHSNGDVMSRAVNDMDNISNTLQQSLTQLVTSIVTFLGVLYMMLTISWQLTLVAVATVPLSLIVVGIVAPKSQRFFASQQKSLGLLNNQIEETYSGHVVVKSFNREAASIETFEKENEVLFKSSWKAQFISGLIMPLMNFIKNLH